MTTKGHRLLSDRRIPLLFSVTLTAVAAVAAAAAIPQVAPATTPVTAKLVPAAKGLDLLRERSIVYTRNGKFGPYGPNPATSLVPDGARVDWGGWRRAQAAHGKAAARTQDAARRPTPHATVAASRARYVREDEPAGIRGGNDSFASAQAIPTFGTSKRRYPAYTVLGRQSPVPVPALATVAPNVNLTTACH